MKKVLPINLNPGVELECWQFYRLAVLMTDNKFYNWFLERFNNIYMYTDFSCSYYNWEVPYFFDLYNEVMDYYDMITNNEIVKSVVYELDKERYVLALCDRYYIKGSQEYLKKHTRHELLILGYNEEHFYFVDININGKLWSINEVLFSEFEESFNKSLFQIRNQFKSNSWITQYNLPLVSMKPKTNCFNRQYRLASFLNCINMNLEGKKMESKLYINKEDRMPNVYRTGIAIYEGYYKDLYRFIENKKGEIDAERIIYGVNKLLESKKNFKLKLEYIMCDKNQKNQVIIDRAVELMENIKLALNILMKYFFAKEKKYFEKACDYFRKAESVDYELLQLSSQYIEELIEDEIKKI